MSFYCESVYIRRQIKLIVATWYNNNLTSTMVQFKEKGNSLSLNFVDPQAAYKHFYLAASPLKGDDVTICGINLTAMMAEVCG